MDVGAVLTWLSSLGLGGTETLLAGTVIALAAALVCYARHAEQQDRAERQHQREEYAASRSYLQTMITRLMEENGRHATAATTAATTLDDLSERIARIEAALMERRR